MFSSKGKESDSAPQLQTPDSGSINIIGNGTEIVGEIKSLGDVRIDGKLIGNITTAGKLVVGPSGIIEGNVSSKNCDVSGKITGRIDVAELLSLKASANIHGDVTTGKLAIEAGAIFTGTCDMDGKKDYKRQLDKTPQRDTKQP